MDRETLLNIVEGDHVAYSKLYVDYFKKLYNYGKKFTDDIALLQDSIQEVFLDIWIKKEKLKEIETAGSYFFSSFRYILLRKIKQSGKIIQSTEFKAGIELSRDHIIIDKEESDELKRKLQSALNTLTAHQREAIFLRFYEGLSYEEVAAVLDISVKATYKIMARSLSALKDSMLISISTLLLLLDFHS